MKLLERTELSNELAALLARAGAGRGAIVFASGEAGIGKTSLVAALRDSAGSGVRVLWGQADPLSTPSPLGPLRDIAHQLASLGRPLPPLDAPRAELFSAVLAALNECPTLAVFEDVHWADAATMDLLRYLGRRAERTHTLLIATYRDDEIGASHPLRIVLGDLASAGIRRLSIPPLSLAAVRTLIDERPINERPIDAVSLHRITAGNAFFVTEALAAGGIGIPATVRDAVLARAARLDPSARSVLEFAAVAGPVVEPSLLSRVVAAEAGSIAACEASGILRRDGDTHVFRHELGRQAILDAIAPQARARMHRTVLDVLRTAPAAVRTDAARFAHHATLAGDGDAVLAYAPTAAREAAARGAHFQARSHSAAALEHAAGLPPAERAALIELYANECHAVGEHEAAIVARRQAAEIRRALDDLDRVAENLCRASGSLINVGRTEEAEAGVDQVLALLESHPPGRGHAYAYRSKAFMCMLRRDNAEAISWGTRAIALSHALGDKESLGAAYNSVGSAMIHIDYDAGCRMLERALPLGRECGSSLMERSALINLGSASGEVHRFIEAEHYLLRAIALGDDEEIDVSYPRAWLALCQLHLGRWDDAGATASSVLAVPRQLALSHNMAQIALGRLRARRGDAGVDQALDEALRLAEVTGHLQRLGPVRAARAEAAFLAGDLRQCADEARAAYDLAAGYRHGWFVGELAYWLMRAGQPVECPDYAAPPYALQIAGDWSGAADAWKQLACPYEQARALAEGDGGAQLQALAIFDSLGARPAAETLRLSMRARGERGVPRGPRATTRAHPYGLTAREVDILAQLAEGLTNAQIATRNHRSVRTVDHQVAAILGKLGADSRGTAVARAREQKLIDVDRRRQK